MNIIKTNIKSLEIEGYAGDYIFEEISKRNWFYEAEILEKWSPIFKDARIALDIGANIGNHSIYWATEMQFDAIYSFEPLPANYERLVNNVASNGLSNVIPINKAISDQPGTVIVDKYDEKNLGGTSFIKTEINSSQVVQAMSVDEFVAENQIDTIDFVKVDTEGNEVNALLGMNKTVKTFNPAIWVEVSYQSYAKVMEILASENYVLVDCEGFNLLFLHPTKYREIKTIGQPKLMDSMFKYLEKTNLYYGHYLTAKEWLANKDSALNILKLSNENLKEKYSAVLGQYQESKEGQLKSQLADAKNEIEELRNAHNDFINVLQNITNDFSREKELLEKIKKQMMSLQTQNTYLKQENEEYRRKLSKITDTWYGQYAVRIYKILKEFINRLKH